MSIVFINVVVIVATILIRMDQLLVIDLVLLSVITAELLVPVIILSFVVSKFSSFVKLSVVDVESLFIIESRSVAVEPFFIVVVAAESLTVVVLGLLTVVGPLTVVVLGLLTVVEP